MGGSHRAIYQLVAVVCCLARDVEVEIELRELHARKNFKILFINLESIVSAYMHGQVVGTCIGIAFSVPPQSLKAMYLKPL